MQEASIKKSSPDAKAKTPKAPAKTSAKIAGAKTNPISAQVKKLKKLIEQSLDADKAEDIIAVDIAAKSSLADYMIVASGTSQKHITTLADHLAEKLYDMGLSAVPMEGKGASDWVVLDAGAIIVHLFRPEARQHYNLEKMWGVADMPMEAAL